MSFLHELLHGGLFAGDGEGGGSGDVTIVPLSVSANGTYTAAQGKAYSPVTVDTPEPPELDTLNVSANGSYTPESGHAFDEVNVAVSQTTVESLSVTENGTYTASAGYAFSPVTVNVAGGGGHDDEDGIIDRTISVAYSNSRVTIIGSYAFAYCVDIKDASFPKCTNINTSAFTYCSALTTANFPECVSISAFAFQRCSRMTDISFPKCTYIDGNVFSSCSRLTAADFPECLTVMGDAFVNCLSLSIVSFPKCSSLKATVFNKCYRLLSAYFLGSSVPTLSNSNAFSSTPIAGYTASTGGVLGSIFVKASLLTAWQSATNWAFFSERMVGLTDAQIAALS